MRSAYQEAVAALQARGRYGIRLGLGRTRAILREIGDPHAGIGGALIAGTNGKGSVQALAAAVLREAGLRVGQTPKPHLVEYRERIVVDGEPIAEKDFGVVVSEVLTAAGRIPRRLGPPTEFELLTAAAFTWLARCRIDVAIVEVGLGGRLDATNVWDGGVAAVTNVAFDHMDRLGDTLSAIGREKAAIIKRGDLAVTGATGEALAVIRRRARRMGVPLAIVAPLPVLGMDRDGIVVEAPGLGATRVGLLGRHQAANVAVALATLDALEAAGLAAAPREARRAGLAAARWPGRMELLTVRPDPSRGPVDVLLDGAHNPAGFGTLLGALEDLRPQLSAGRFIFVTGFMADKDVAAILDRCFGHPAIRGARILATRVDVERAMPAAQLARAWRERVPGSEATAVEPPERALAEALEAAARDGGVVVVAGSLYLVGAVRASLASRGLIA
jgi:dihydrofolate synthase / folylpolyglutamate synthase